MNEQSKIIAGNDISYNQEIMAVLSGMSIMFQNPYASRKKKESFILRGRSHKERHPWDNIHLSKADRKGKTYEQMQELRSRKWERQCNKRLQSDKNPPREVMTVKLI